MITDPPVTVEHPLDPLTAEEVVAACAIVRAAAAERLTDPLLRFPVVAVAEPTRSERRAFAPGDRVVRRAEVLAFDRTSGSVLEVIVNLSAAMVERWHRAEGAVPLLLFDECMAVIDVVRSDPRWAAAVRARGVTDVEAVQVDPWPAGNFGLPGEEGRRITRCVSYTRDTPDDNGYAHPIEGLVAVVDLSTNEVIDVIDTGVVPIPSASGRYDADHVGPLRSGLKPLVITQPEGPSFELSGNRISWLGWELRFTVHPVEGLVLYGVSYLGRPILERASIAEMVVPYGATGTNHWWKNAFDVGEWGLGRMIQSLALGCDCLGEIRYADAVLPDEFGGARVVANAVCVHEEDYGVLWKHVDLWARTDEVRRSRRLVVSSISTVGNYEYGFYWYFYLDGTIQLEVKLTGIMQTGACDPEATEAPDHGALIGPGLWAPNHQHLFCARLDVGVDGPANAVAEVDVVGAEPGPGNEHANAILTTTTVLETEDQAGRMADPLRSRRWRILNRGARNALGGPTAYDLVPQSPVTLVAGATSSVARRATFATRSLWVTPYDPDQRRPAGEHPNQSPGGDGLPAWTVAGRSILDREVVLWHTFGVSHVPRPEDWPVMPVEYAGFVLRPVGFFARNPALDLPSPHHGHPAGQ